MRESIESCTLLSRNTQVSTNPHSIKPVCVNGPCIRIGKQISQRFGLPHGDQIKDFSVSERRPWIEAKLVLENAVQAAITKRMEAWIARVSTCRHILR